MASSVPAVRAAAVAVLQGLFPPPTLIVYGAAGSNLADEIVGLGGTTTKIERPTSTTQRTREETVETEVIFSVWTGAGPEQDQVITERAYVMLSAFADYFKTKPNETLSGACREALVTAYDDAGGVGATYEPDPDSPGGFIVTGRLIEITAVLTARTRI